MHDSNIKAGPGIAIYPPKVIQHLKSKYAQRLDL